MINDNPHLWPQGMLRCKVDSPVVRVIPGTHSVPYTYTSDEEKLEDIHVDMLVDPLYVAQANFDIGKEIEQRLLYQLVEYGITHQVWPSAPIIWWHRWDREFQRWLMTERP